jgi:hypothetical protein
MKKIVITDTLDDVFIDGSIESAIAELEELKEKYSDKYDRLFLETETYQIPYDDWSYAKVVLYGEREETDSEFEKRIEKDKKYKERQKEADKKELARLKKLYEKDNK